MIPIFLSSVIWLTFIVTTLNSKGRVFQSNNTFMVHQSKFGHRVTDITSPIVQQRLVRDEYANYILTGLYDQYVKRTHQTTFDRDRPYTSVTDNNLPINRPSDTTHPKQTTTNGGSWTVIHFDEHLMLFSLILHLLFKVYQRTKKVGLCQTIPDFQDVFTENSRTKKIIANKENRLNMMARQLWSMELIDRLKDNRLDQKRDEINEVYKKLEELYLQKYPQILRKATGDSVIDSKPNPSTSNTPRGRYRFSPSWYKIHAVQFPVHPLPPPVVSRRRPQHRK